MNIKHNFTSEQELKETLDFIYEKSKTGKGFNGILEAAFNKVTTTGTVKELMEHYP